MPYASSFPEVRLGLQAFTAGANWFDDHKAVIAGAVVGTAVGIGC
jgi:hypothetical protein